MTAAARVPTKLPAARGWQGRIELEFAARGGRTVLARRPHRGPLVVQRPFYPEGDACHVYLLHPPGGIVGGDRLQVELAVGAGSAAVLTTPGAGKFYRSAGDTGRLQQHFAVDADASLEWLPQETIVFEGARGEAHTRVEVAPGGRYIGWEVVCLGRPAAGETFGHGQFRQTLEVRLGDGPGLLERFRAGGSDDVLHLPAGMRGLPVIGTMVATPADTVVLEAARASLSPEESVACSCTLIDGLLVVRYLGPRADIARAGFLRVWQAIRQLVCGRLPCPPRIWNT